MPSNLIKSINEKTGIPISELENKWEKAKKLSKKQYNLTEASKKFWPITVGIFKNSLGKDVEEKIAAHIEAFTYIKAGTDIEETTSIPELDYNKIKRSLIKKAHDLSGIPIEALSKKWDAVKEAVISTYIIEPDDIQFLPKLLSSFYNSLSAMNPEYGMALSSTFDLAIEGSSSKIKAPSTRSLPVDINPEAIHLWKEVIKRERKTINQYKDNLYKWAAAIVLFKKLCAKKGIPPFTTSVTKKQSKDPVETFLAGFADPCITTIEKIEKYLKSKNLVVKNIPKKFKLDKISKNNKNRLLLASKQWKLRKTETAAGVVLLLIPQFGLRKYGARGSYRRKQSSNSAIVVKYTKKTANVITVTIEIKINSRMWNSLSADKKSVKKYLTTWVNKGFKASASESPTEDHDYIIKTHYPANSKDEAINLINKMTVSTIVNLGDSEFQLKLANYVKYIGDAFDIEVPKSIIEFINSGTYRENARKEYGNSLPNTTEEEGAILSPKFLKG